MAFINCPLLVSFMPEGFIKAGGGEFNDAVVSLVKPRGLCVNDGKDWPARLRVCSVV